MKLREAMYGGNPAGVIAVLADRDPQDVLQLAGAALLLALREHVPTTPAVAAEVEVALRRRDWDGDQELADELQAGRSGAAPPGRPLAVDLEDLIIVLEGDLATNEGGFIDLRTGEVLPRGVTDAFEVGEDAAVDIEEDPDRWLYVPCLGSRDGWRDMADFCERVTDARTRQRLERALEGRGAFRRFKDAAHEAGYLNRWYVFSAERGRGRARAWLANQGIRAVP